MFLLPLHQYSIQWHEGDSILVIDHDIYQSVESTGIDLTPWPVYLSWRSISPLRGEHFLYPPQNLIPTVSRHLKPLH